ncbi:MFS transporter [Apilactobacillus apinorum]|uniref:MFS transporter n=1 Tax=Apilactobacillus apinorum TaxID=1218495 RepID=UPI0006B574B6|nr:MFS transporter [Apilactobacillus apinorum]KOY68399.1 H+ antiporter-2 family protein [Apilactobacillus apinorum]CAI2687233.1 PECL_398 H+ antiporter-2 family protein [Apilactobacillus apinorum]
MQSRNKWFALVAVCLGFFMGLLDVTVVNVALPTIQSSFNSSFSQLQWVINAYTLMFAAVLFLISKLGDLIGRKRIFIISLVLFSVFSLACSLAPSITYLIIFRGIQGIGGAGMLSLSMSIIADIFEGSQRGLALGIWGSVAGLSTALGPLFGGILLSFFSWESIFLMNIPIGVIALFMSVKYIPISKTFNSGKIDFLGMLLSFAFMFSIILGLIQKETHYEYSWFNYHVFALLAIGVVLIIVFVLWEHHFSSPMLDLKLLTNRYVVGSAISNLTLGVSIYSAFSYIIILSQNYMGYSALQSGAQLMLISAFSLVIGPISGKIATKINPGLIISLVFVLAGLGMFVLPVFLGSSNHWFGLIPTFITLGLANAFVNPLSSNIAVSSVEPKEIGMTSGLLNVGKQFGTSLGVVVLGLALTSSYNDRLVVSKLPDKLMHLFENAGPFSASDITAKMHSDWIASIVHSAFYSGIDRLAITNGFIFIGAGILCYIFLCMKKKKA